MSLSSSKLEKKYLYVNVYLHHHLYPHLHLYIRAGAAVEGEGLVRTVSLEGV